MHQPIYELTFNEPEARILERVIRKAQESLRKIGPRRSSEESEELSLVDELLTKIEHRS